MPLQTIEYLVVLTWLFLLGAVVGSLLNVCIYRLPRAERVWPALKSLWYPPSHCPRCSARIAIYDNVPILGWLILKGRCRNCRGRIAARYPTIELLTALLFVVVYWFEIPDWWGGPKASCLFHVYGPQGDPASAWMTPWLMLHYRYALHMLLVVALVVATFIDIDLRIIPDAVTLPAMAGGLAANFLLGQLFVVPVWYQTPAMLAGFPTDLRLFLSSLSPPQQLPGWFEAGLSSSGVPAWVAAHPHLHGLAVSVCGILVGGGVVWGVRLVGQWMLKREAMGFGDVILMAMIGSFLGWQATLIIFFVAPVCALVSTAAGWIFWRNREIPYGPYLSLATLLLILFFRQLWPWVEVRVFALGPLLPLAALIMFIALAGLLFITRTIQKFLGIAHGEEPEWIPQWASGDQLAYLAGGGSDNQPGSWPRPLWRGALSGRGLAHQHDWRHPPAPAINQFRKRCGG